MEYNKIDVLKKAAESIFEGNSELAKKYIEVGYPFTPVKRDTRTYTVQEMIEQFYRDGFVDRYSGERLINPGMLRVMSEKLPDVFPYQAHWKTEECHMAYWDFQPTVDHVKPIALGGKDQADNWASTSMVNNSSKSNFTLEQLGWTLKKPGDIEEWDGLSKVFIKIVEDDPSLLNIKKIKEWYVATKRTKAKLEV
jgi:hypothetical protein